jgi:hypothetical protein
LEVAAAADLRQLAVVVDMAVDNKPPLKLSVQKG